MPPIESTESRGAFPSSTTGETLVDRGVAALARRERLLWIGAALALFADVVTTVAGLQAGLAEGNPVVASALADAGLAGFVAVKVTAFALAIGARIALPRFRVAIPLGIALPWCFVAVTNAVLLLAVA